jgi:putative ABC transport system permease protein
MAVRTAANPRLLIGPVREVMHKLDPMKPAHSISPLEDLESATVVSDRYAMTLVACFAVTALSLAVLGIYGLLTYRVREQLPEIGIRMALGADRKQILRWILSEGFRLTVIGILLGLAGSLLLTKLLSGLLFHVAPNDLFTLISVSLLLILFALLGCLIPARSATKIDPMKVLRNG